MFAFMWLNKLIVNRILYYNRASRSVQKTSLVDPLNVNAVKTNHLNIGSVVPTTIPGSKNYWNARTLDLVAATRQFGKPDLFVTLTHNDNWYELQSALGNDQSLDDFNVFDCFDVPPKDLDPTNSIPVENVIAFVKRFKLFRHHFLSVGKPGPFGIVQNFYYRFEYQK